jgi:hypothetical protein
MRRTYSLFASAAFTALLLSLLVLSLACDDGDNTNSTHITNANASINTNAQSGNANIGRLSTTPSPNATPLNVENAGASSVGNLIKNLPEGKLALDAPGSMQQGVSQTVTARVSFGDIGATIKEGLPQSASTETIKVGESMKVVLTAKEQDAFSIKEESDATQIVVGKPYAEWIWEVKPLKSGKHDLHLSAAVILTPQGQTEKPFVIPTKDKDIDVQVNYKYVAGEFVSRYWSVLFGGVSVLSVLTGARKAYGWWKGRGGNAQPPAS